MKFTQMFNEMKAEFKKGDKVVYLGEYPAVIRAVKIDVDDRIFYTIKYEGKNGKVGVSDILSTDGTITKKMFNEMKTEFKKGDKVVYLGEFPAVIRAVKIAHDDRVYYTIKYETPNNGKVGVHDIPAEGRITKK